MSKFFYMPSDALLHVIQNMIDENSISRKMNGNCHSDYLEGSNSALKALAVEIGLCEWEDFKE